MVGDRPDTDGLFARRLGFRFALVLSGATTSLHDMDPQPDLVGPDLAAIVSAVLAA
jgi:ribonucleotide monophosphatase NagD (HAD superfamily)